MPDERDTAQGQASGGTKSAKADSKNVIDSETAEAEFASYCEANDISYDTADMTDEEKADFDPIKKRFLKACMQGRLEVDGTDLKYTISKFSADGFKGEVVKIKRADGHAFMGMDGYKDTQSVHKIHGFLSAMTGKDTSYFTKIDRSDWLFFRDIATLFLVD
jgi:hypothetical protein